jgi:hypothetical protein
MGQQIVGSFADCAIGSINTFVQAVANPHRKITQVTAAIGDLFRAKRPADTMPGSWDSNSDSNECQPNASQAQATTKRPAPEYLDDPAYSLVLRCTPLLHSLHALLHNGEAKGVDWENAMGESNSIRFVSGSLEQLLKECSGKGPRNPPSEQLFSIINTCAGICDAMKTEAEKGLNLNASHPSAETKCVKDWQDKFASQYEATLKMDALARSLPGSTTGVSPHVAQIHDLAEPLMPVRRHL